MVGKEREVSDKSPVEKGSKVSESEEGSVLTVGRTEGSGFGEMGGIFVGGEEGEEDDDDGKKASSVSQVTRAEAMEIIQSVVVKSAKEMMRWW